jgi:hypothetical protein
MRATVTCHILHIVIFWQRRVMFSYLPPLLKVAKVVFAVGVPATLVRRLPSKFAHLGRTEFACKYFHRFHSHNFVRDGEVYHHSVHLTVAKSVERILGLSLLLNSFLGAAFKVNACRKLIAFLFDGSFNVLLSCSTRMHFTVFRSLMSVPAATVKDVERLTRGVNAKVAICSVCKCASRSLHLLSNLVPHLTLKPVELYLHSSCLSAPPPTHASSLPPPPPCEQQAAAVAVLQGKPDMVQAAYEGLLDVIAARAAIGEDVNQGGIYV